MDRETYDALAKARIERAKELQEEAKILLESGKYKSANNRAFYSYRKKYEGTTSKQGNRC